METKLYDHRTGLEINSKMDLGNIKSLQGQCNKDRATCREKACYMMVKVIRAGVQKIRICDIEIK